MAHCHVAIHLHAGGVDALGALLDFTTQISAPALIAERVVAGERETTLFINVAIAANAFVVVQAW